MPTAVGGPRRRGGARVGDDGAADGGGPGVVSVLSVVCLVLGAYGYLLCSVAEYVGAAPKAMSFWVAVAAAFGCVSSTGFNPNLSRWLPTGSVVARADDGADVNARG